MKKILILFLVFALMGGTIASILVFAGIGPGSSTKTDPFADVPAPVIRSLRYADFRGQDLASLDLSKSGDIFPTFTFDSKTVWPGADKMPSGISPQKIMEQGKYLGLGLSALHREGLTGKGVSVAVIDKPILPDHVEFSGNMTYIEVKPDHPNAKQVHFHGAAVASILAGKHGVAPGARLYYFAVPDDADPYARYTEAMMKLLEYQKTLPERDKIRVVVVSHGIEPEALAQNEGGARDWAQAIEKARGEGIIVVYPGMNEINFTGTGALPGKDRDDPSSYDLWTWTKAKKEVAQKLKDSGVNSWDAAREELKKFLTDYPELDALTAEAAHTFIYFSTAYRNEVPFSVWLESVLGEPGKTLAVPADYLTVADVRAKDAYAYYGSGGLSWAAPYLAGLMALGFQAKPGATQDEILKALWDSSTPFLGESRLVNPRGFIGALGGNLTGK